MLCLDYFYNFYNLFDDTIDAASLARQKTFVQNLESSSLALLVLLYPY